MMGEAGSRPSWLLVGSWVLLAGICLFPYLAGVVAMNDEVALVYHLNGATSLSGEDIGRWVWTYKFFRPLDQLLAPYLVDALSRDARIAMLLHLPGLLGLIVVASYWTLRLIPGEPLVVPAMLIALAMSTGTSLSLWQLDTSTQTWSAAVGIWQLGLVWLVAQERMSGAPGPSLWLLAAVGLLGVLTKETFIGWAAVSVLLLLLCWLRSRKLPLQASVLRWSQALLAAGLIPGLFLMSRLLSTKLGEVAVHGEGHYGVHIGANLFKNAALSVLGFFPNGPTHTIFGLQSAPSWVRVMSPITLACCLSLILMPWLYSRLLKQEYPLSKRAAVYVAALLCFLASAVVWPTRQISEVNLFGPNLGGALLVALGVVDARRVLSAAGSSGAAVRVARGILWGTVAAALVLLSLGLVSRGRHMAVSWHWVVELKQSIRTHQLSLPEGKFDGGVFIPVSCQGDGSGYSQIILSPERALRPARTLWWLNYENPGRRIYAYRLSPEEKLTARDMILPCDTLQRRPWW